VRSIGKKNIKLVQNITKKVLRVSPRLANFESDNIISVVTARLPDRLWDTWEMADQEIRKVVLDTVLSYDESH